MNGRCFSWDGVRKNVETGSFEPTSGEGERRETERS